MIEECKGRCQEANKSVPNNFTVRTALYFCQKKFVQKVDSVLMIIDLDFRRYLLYLQLLSTLHLSMVLYDPFMYERRILREGLSWTKKFFCQTLKWCQMCTAHRLVNRTHRLF